MRKQILLLMALCLHLAARGQTGYTYDYWFDNDRNTLQSGSSSSGNWQLQADVSGLSETIHAIHLQVSDQEGNQSSPVTRFFIKTNQLSKAKGRYWFDEDIEHIYTSSQVHGLMDIDVSMLSEGFHTIHYQVEGTKGNVSATATRSFFKTYVPANSSWRCWFDNDYTTVLSGKDMSQTLLLDVSQLADGYHVLHIQVDGGAQSASTPITKHFVKIPQTKGIDNLTCLCMVDDKLFKQEKVPAGGVVTWNFDVSQLAQGFHRIFVQIVTPSGAASNTYQSFFLRETTHSEFAQMKCVYAIDGAEFYAEAGTMANGTYHFDLDVSSLDDGLHRIAYMLTNGKGISTKAQSQFFMKTPLGGNGITEYWYWLNEQGDEQAQKVVLPERKDPFSLITLLPVESQPIRSSLFQFRVEQNKPVIYAKNDIHIRFYDATGRFTDVSKQFVDESVKQEISAEQLESGIQVTTAKPEANAIKWYCLEAEPGDSLQFKLDRAASIQLFAPSGKEVYSVSGAESVYWGGLHVFETGTYYLALHDVTAQLGTTISIDYNHIDKYAVLRQDIAVVGNGGCSTITFEGNGFYNLKDIVFSDGNNIIKANNIEYISDSEVAVMIDFSNKSTGNYNALFDFGDETRTRTNTVTVETSDSIHLKLNVDNPHQFLRGSIVTYTIKITNSGNSTAYRIPIEMQLYTHSKTAINYAKFSENIPKLDVDWMDTTIVEKDSIAALKSYIAQQGDLLHFLSAYDTISNRYIKDCHFAIDVAPKSTYIITLSLKSDEAIEFQAIIPSKWIFYSYNDGHDKLLSKAHRASAKDNICCVREKVECVMNVLVGALDFISIIGGPQLKIADCIASLGNTTLQYAYDVWCGESNGGKNPRKAAEDLAWDAVNGLVGCICNITGIDKLNIQWMYQHIYNNIKTTMDCITAFTQKIPNCPPDPDPDGGSSSPVPPSDPNDIYGYLSDAGSKFIADSVAKVNYTIEFENDTTFAKASAHTIVIKDTLDSRYFDLQSFLPTSIKLGSRETFIDEAEVIAKSGKTSFLKTIDMRPEINAIAQVEGTYSQKTGIAEWRFTSLDPMTMEQTDDLMQGILPVNYDGTSGIGEVMYEIGVKPNKADGTEIPNRAGIVFDYEDAIMTPTWTNIVDATAPKSRITDVAVQTDSTATVSIEASDELSGVWRYDVYVQYGTGSAWFKAAENVPADTTATVKIYEGIYHGFYVVATDSAGNVERKEAMRELSLNLSTIIRGDANCDQAVDVADVVAIVNKILGEPNEPFVEAAADVNGDGKIDVDDVVAVVNIILDSGQQNAREMMRALKACGFRF